MKKNRFGVLLCVVLVIGLVVYFYNRLPSPLISVVKAKPTPAPKSVDQSPSPLPIAQQQQTNRVRPDQKSIDKYATAFTMPISYWGKVVDEKGVPIGGVTVAWSANNNPMPGNPGTKGKAVTDADGMFSITSHGIGLYVEVSKSGYYQVPTETRSKLGSFGGFDNPSVIEKTDSPLGTHDNPAVYSLHTKGESAQLIQVTERPIRIPKDGTAVNVDLATGQTMSSAQKGLKVQCWTNDQSKDAKGQYIWSCQLSVLGGGLIERTDQYAFEAPADGYKSSMKISPPPDQWSARAERQYFVKLPDNSYARIDFRIRTGGDHYFVIESYVNPIPGNRNLEFDPAKVVKSP